MIPSAHNPGATARQQRWLRIIPVALIMYTISYVDRTNISLALDPKISHMMRDLLMDDRLKGQAAGLFFLGYALMQVPAGYLATRWSAKKLVSIFLISWGICAVGCGLASTFQQFEIMRFLLGVAESGVFPVTTVLLANWFPRSERARANGYWNLCQPLAIVASAHLTAHLLGQYGWQNMLIIEGALPFLWLPIWWFCIQDHPAGAKWISAEERNYLENALDVEAAEVAPVAEIPFWKKLCRREIPVMMIMNFFHNFAAYGCMTFFTSILGAKVFSTAQYGTLFAVPYAFTAVVMVLNSRHSDRTGERRGHVAAVYVLSGVSLIASVILKDHFWLAYALMCVAITGPFAALAPFWAIPSETMPRNVMGPVIGLVNAFGSGLGGFTGPYFTGWLKDKFGSVTVPFSALGAGLIIAAGLAFCLPKSRTAARIR